MSMDEFDIADTTAPCPVCEGAGILWGLLGNLAWYSCRNCGMKFYIEGHYTEPFSEEDIQYAEEDYEGYEGQDRENYTDIQDRENYTIEEV